MSRKITLLLTIFFLIFVFKSFSQNDTTKVSTEAIPTITISPSELQSDEESQDISGLLQSSRDIFVSTAGYTFGPARFHIRGYDYNNTNVLIDGVPVNDMETGRAYWSTWGGLNDVTRNKEINTGIVPSRYLFSGIGGVTNIITRASTYRKSVKLTYSLSNRSYRNRVMFTVSTGLMKNNWAVTVSGSRRWAQNGYVTGTFYDAWGYFLSLEKKINKHHSIGFTAFGAPIKRGKPGVSTQETYYLAGSNYYNPYWGYQCGKKRNSRVSNYHTPMMILSHYWDFNKKTSLKTSLSYSFGRGGSTALNWYDVNDPRPDYYKNLPSYFKDDDFMFNKITNLWKNDENYRQIKWDDFYFANRKNLYTVNNIDGIEGNDLTGNRSKYIVEDRRNDHNQTGFNSILNYNLNENIYITGGLNLNWYKGYHFKKIVDLLGGEYWLDIDQFAERDFENPQLAQSDLLHPNRIVKEGDKFGYDYSSNINKYGAFAQSEFSYKKLDFYLAGTLAHTCFWRTGNMKDGKFPDDSYGNSEKQNYTNYGAKAGVTYKINGRNYLSSNFAYLTRAPLFRNAYISPRTRDFVLDGLTSEKILSGDINYIIHAPFLKSRVTFYYTKFNDQSWARSFYHDELRSFVNYLMTGVDKMNFGTEIGIEAPVTSTITLTGVLAKGQYIYDSRPKVTISQDNDSKILAKDRTVYLKNFMVGGMPQTAASVGIKYNSPKYWFVGLNVNYFDDIYLSLNPDRRTADAVEGLIPEDPQWDQLIKQEHLDKAYTLNMFCGKSWKIKDYYINLNLSINNLLDNNNFIIGGFEQYRYNPRNVDKFPPKYFYLYGRNFFLNLSFRI